MFLSVRVLKLIANKAQSQTLAAVGLQMYTSNQTSDNCMILSLEKGEKVRPDERPFHGFLVLHKECQYIPCTQIPSTFHIVSEPHASKH